MLHVEVAPAPPTAAAAQATARRILAGVTVQYLPSGQVARKLQLSSRALGKITGAPQAAEYTPTHSQSASSGAAISGCPWIKTLPF